MLTLGCNDRQIGTSPVKSSHYKFSERLKGRKSSNQGEGVGFAKFTEVKFSDTKLLEDFMKQTCFQKFLSKDSAGVLQANIIKNIIHEIIIKTHGSHLTWSPHK